MFTRNVGSQGNTFIRRSPLDANSNANASTSQSNANASGNNDGRMDSYNAERTEAMRYASAPTEQELEFDLTEAPLPRAYPVTSSTAVHADAQYETNAFSNNQGFQASTPFEAEILVDGVGVAAEPLSIEDEVTSRTVRHNGPINVFDATVGRLESEQGDISVKEATIRGGIRANDGCVDIIDVGPIGNIEAGTLYPQLERPTVKAHEAESLGAILARSGNVELSNANAFKGVTALNGNITFNYVDTVQGFKKGNIEAPLGNVTIQDGCQVNNVQAGGLVTLGKSRTGRDGVTANHVTASMVNFDSVTLKGSLTLTTSNRSQVAYLRDTGVATVTWRPEPIERGFADALETPPLQVYVLEGSQVGCIEFSDEVPGQVYVSSDSTVNDVTNGSIIHIARPE